MGLFDKLKSNVMDKFVPQAQQQPHTHAAPIAEIADDLDATPVPSDEVEFDLAGFDPEDEQAFFNAVLHMESEGQFGGTDESRAEIMQQRGIRDRTHCQVVKESVYALLIRKYGAV